MKIIETMNVQGKYAKGKNIKNVINYIQYSGESSAYRMGMVDTLRTLGLISLEDQRTLIDIIKQEV